MDIRPVSDMQNKFPEIEKAVLKNEEPVYLTKNGYGSMIVMSLEQYAELTDNVELKLDEADFAAVPEERYTGEDVFLRVRRRIRERKALGASFSTAV